MLGKLKDAATRCVLRPVRQNAFAVPGSAAPPDPLDGFGEGDRKEGNGKDGKGMEGGRRGNEKGWGNGINGSLRLFFLLPLSYCFYVSFYVFVFAFSVLLLA